MTTHFVPVKVHIKEQEAVFERFGAQWTPTILVLDASGEEHHRIEGFLPADDFLAQLEIGLGKREFHASRFKEARRHFQSACEQHPKTGGAPEACYWAGVAAYKDTNDPKQLGATGGLLKARYPDSEWARKASVWLH